MMETGFGLMFCNVYSELFWCTPATGTFRYDPNWRHTLPIPDLYWPELIRGLGPTPPPWNNNGFHAAEQLLHAGDDRARVHHRGPSYSQTQTPPPSYIPCTPGQFSPPAFSHALLSISTIFLTLPGRDGTQTPRSFSAPPSPWSVWN